MPQSAKAAVHSYATGWAGAGIFLLSLLTLGPFQDQLRVVIPAPYAQYLPLVFAVAGTAMTWFGKGPLSSPAPAEVSLDNSGAFDQPIPAVVKFPPNPYAASGIAAKDLAMSSLAAKIAALAVAALEANKDSVVAALSAAEGGVEAKIAQIVDGYAPPAGALAYVWPFIKPAIVAELAKAEAEAPGSVLYAWIDDELKAFTAKLAA